MRQELKILNNKIDKVEAQAACEELTDLESSIRRLENSSKTTASQVGGSYTGRWVVVILAGVMYISTACQVGGSHTGGCYVHINC